MEQQPSGANGVLSLTYRTARKIAIAVIGGSVVLFGIALLVLPGPAFIVIPLGLGILSLEFTFARYWLLKVKQRTRRVARRVRKRRAAERTQQQDS